MAQEKVFYASGMRKTSTARVFLRPGTGKMTINGRESDKYLTTQSSRASLQQPFNATDNNGKFDAYITVSGGGLTGQAEAIRHGIARALLLVDAEHRPSLKKAGYLRRDPRMVERKKYGFHKARKSTQFSKR